MHIVIAGGSGFVGKTLQEKFLKQGYSVTILTRNPNQVMETNRLHAVKWLIQGSKPEEQLERVDAIINLAGESINGIRWTKAKKKKILNSRITATREILRIISMLKQKPKVLVNASAVGYYGMSFSETFTEETESFAGDFLAKVVQTWEKEALMAKQYGVRVVLARLGVVLGHEGALPLMVLPYKLGVGGTVGTGKQWLSWIQVEDVADLIQFAIENDKILGPLNVTAPEPIKMREFGVQIGEVLRRPHWLTVPSFAMKVLLGEMSDMLLQGQRAIPKKALEHQFHYRFPDLNSALEKSLLNESVLKN